VGRLSEKRKWSLYTLIIYVRCGSVREGLDLGDISRLTIAFKQTSGKI
jgi:hypothetical protein